MHRGWPLEAPSGTRPPLSQGPQQPAHDLPLGWQLPNRTTPTLGAEELLSSMDCPPALSLPRAFLAHPPGAQPPTFSAGPDAAAGPTAP